jgi:ribosomal protein S24E
MKIISDNKNDLFKRREVKMVVENSGNPGFANALKLVAGQFKASEDNIAVHNVKGKFGRDTFLIDASIYNSKEDKEKTEPKPKMKKAAEGAAPAVGAK